MKVTLKSLFLYLEEVLNFYQITLSILIQYDGVKFFFGLSISGSDFFFSDSFLFLDYLCLVLVLEYHWLHKIVRPSLLSCFLEESMTKQC